MISKDCKFADFVGAVRSKNYFEILEIADQEATDAERIFLRSRSGKAAGTRCGKEYAERIKQFIDYLRFEVKPRARSVQDAAIFAAIAPDRRSRRGV
jgi:hypothetical protein